MPPVTSRYPPLRFRQSTFSFDRAYVVAVLNVTPDSFSDGGLYGDVESAVRFGVRCVEAGADALDVGGESTRPQQARTVSAQDERARILPVIQALAARVNVPISVDTTKADVAAAALAAGAEIVNDIAGGRFDPHIVDVAARAGAAYVLGHVRGDSLAAVHAAEAAPPSFADVTRELAARLDALPDHLRARTIVDPGIGFGKRTPGNLELLRRAGELAAALGRPVMVGPSRKRFLGELTGRAVDDRDDATVGACLGAVGAGAHFVRVHDVKRVRDALTVFEAVQQGRGSLR